jgi:hypothetical protein
VEVLPSGIFVSILTEGSVQDVTVAKLQSTYRVPYKVPSPHSLKCNVRLESLSVDSQNIPGATLKRRGSWVISVSIRKYRTARRLNRMFIRILLCHCLSNFK